MAAATVPTAQDPRDYLAGVEPERRRLEGFSLLELMTGATGTAGVMWGPSIVGFGTYTYKYASGRTGDWMRVAFSPRKAALSLYGLRDCGDAERLLESLGPHTSGAGCIYVKRLDALDLGVLTDLVRLSYERRKEYEV